MCYTVTIGVAHFLWEEQEDGYKIICNRYGRYTSGR